MQKKKSGFWAEFTKFAIRGNVADMAIGVIIGASFKTIVDSLVNDVIMPVIGIFIGEDTFTDLVLHVANADIMFGNFISAIINFLIIAIVIFLMVRVVNGVHERLDALMKKTGAPEEPEKPTEPTERELLAEILKTLKEKESL